MLVRAGARGDRTDAVEHGGGTDMQQQTLSMLAQEGSHANTLSAHQLWVTLNLAPPLPGGKEIWAPAKKAFFR